jgi:hypothetical protein
MWIFNEAQKAIGYYLFKGCDDYRDGTIPQRDGGEPAPAQQANTRATISEIYRIWRRVEPTLQKRRAGMALIMRKSLGMGRLESRKS